MTDHVSLDLADFLEGRLAPEQRQELERHIETCAECAAEVAFALRFRESALAQGLAHLRPERIVALSAAPGETTPGEQGHLKGCEGCREELTWAGTTTDGGETDSDHSDDRSPQDMHPRGLYLWIPATVALAALVSLFFLVVSPRLRTGGVPEYAALIVAEPLPVRISRSADADDPFESARLLGLEAYRDRDYAGARGRFEDALAIRPVHPEILLYAGSTELLLGDAARAAGLLDAGFQYADDDALRAELLWQLADARLEQGDVDAARQALEEVIGMGRGRADEARRIMNLLQ